MAQVERATYSIPEAARRLGVSRGLAYELVRRGEFPSRTLTIGTRIVVVRDDLERYIAGRDNAPLVLTNGQTETPTA